MSSQEMEQIIQEYGDDIYRFCFHLTGSREEADRPQTGSRWQYQELPDGYFCQPMEKPDEKGQTSERIDTGSQL